MADLDAAAQVLAGDKTAQVLGGGTILMPRVNAGDVALRRLLRISDPVLRKMTVGGPEITIGAGVSMADILAQQGLAFLHPAAVCVGGPAIRNMATLGGNLFAKAPYGDLAVLLLALGTEVSLAGGRTGPGAARRDPIEVLFRQSTDARAPLVRAVHLARPKAGQVQFHKMARTNPRGPAVVTLAVSLEVSAGRIAKARIALGGIETRPCLAVGVARTLEGAALSEAAITRACAEVLRELTPRSDALASGWYRGEMAQLHLRRILQQMM
ncbi:MAG: FAD binding domain-containing protein [Rhodobacteraceae bacterium]|nr:FAD binding domain-containing protein [Paracoccaceae bacterium]